MSKKKGTNNKKNAKAQEKVQNLEQNEVEKTLINLMKQKLQIMSLQKCQKKLKR